MPTVSRPTGQRHRLPNVSLLTPYDLKVVFEMLAVLPFAWLASPNLFELIANAFARAGSFAGLSDAKDLAATINRFAKGYLDEDSGVSAGFELEARRYQDYMQILRANGPADWRPDIRVEGFDLIEDALALGRGAILWVDHFIFGTLLTAMALQRAGLRPGLATLSTHGFTWSCFGRVVLNPLRCRVEERYLNRIVIGNGDAVAGLRALRAAVLKNGVVTIVAGAWTGRQIHELSFLNGYIGLATGAVTLARSTGAALMPVHALWDGDAGIFRVIVEPPLPVPQKNTGRRQAEDVMAAYLEALKPWVLQFPGQWRGWGGMVARGD